MDSQYLNSLNELDYANLTDHQEKFLRDLERQFNSEFGTAYYFMVMERNKRIEG
jgi:hypothetical protein